MESASKMSESKQEMRKKFLAERKGMTPQQSALKSDEIQKRALGLEQFRKAMGIISYIPVNNEVSTYTIIDTALAQGKKVFLPGFDDGGDEFFLEHTGKLVEVMKGLPQPEFSADRIANEDFVGIAFVPGIAFDRKGFRVGYGGGFYDRMLKGSSFVKVGLCFESQITESVPAESFDQKMDLIITEERVIKC